MDYKELTDKKKEILEEQLKFWTQERQRLETQIPDLETLGGGHDKYTHAAERELTTLETLLRMQEPDTMPRSTTGRR